MAFWDNLSQKASETTVKAVQRAKEMSDIAKLNSMISEEEAKINNTYFQVGKLYVAMHPHDHEDEFVGMITSLVEAEEKIKNYRQQIQDIKGVVRCSQCGAEVQSGVAFCSSCGAPMPKVQSINTDDLVRCEGCGVMVKKGVRFCTSCGKPMVQITKPETAEVSFIESETQNDKRCPKCGTRMRADAAFCTECGTKFYSLREEASGVFIESEIQNDKFCPNCGEKMDSDVAFCTECGTKL